MSVATTMKQVVAEHLGCALEDVSIIQGDTAATPYGAGTSGQPQRGAVRQRGGGGEYRTAVETA